jgi:hypothetical protein
MSTRKRGPMESIGRPPVARREHRREFWDWIAVGVSSEDSARRTSVLEHHSDDPLPELRGIWTCY